MVGSPAKVLGFVSLAIVGSGVLVSQLPFLSLDTRSRGEVVPFEEECNIYETDVPVDNGNGGLKITRILSRVKNKKIFLDERRLGSPVFVKDVEEKGCRNGFKNMYVYIKRSDSRGSYDDKLQEKDGFNEQGVDKTQIKNIAT